MTRISNPTDARPMATPDIRNGIRTRIMCRAELDSALVLRAFADLEPRSDVSKTYRRMADSESEHARRWALRLYEASGRMPRRTPSWLARLLSATARRFGPASVMPVVRRLRRWHHRVARGR